MKCKYEHLMSPVRVGGVMLKNRIINTPSDIHFVQGAEAYPTHETILWLAEKAKNGCGMVNMSCVGVRPDTGKDHGWCWDMTDMHTVHYLSQATQAVHFFGSKIDVSFRYSLPDMFPGYDISTGKPTHWAYGDGSAPRYDLKEAPAEMLEAFAEDFAEKVRILKHDCGFDGLFMHMSYRASIFGRAISALTNDRKDKYGGSFENMARYPNYVADLVRQKCGKDFIIQATVSADPEGSGGNTEDDLMEIVKHLDGHFDILTMKAPEIDPAHAVQFQPRTLWLYLAERAKSVVKKSLISSSGGYFNPDDCEQFITEGKLDLIGSARAWIADPEFGVKIYENRAEDIVPCLRCNKCHKSSYADPWAPYCSVNPVFGWTQRQSTLFEGKPEKLKKVAVIGGGPAGMEAALIASQRGHGVTLYEKEGELGGQLNVTRDVSFKYPLQDFREYLVRQVSKNKIDVVLNCAPDVEFLKEKGYEAIIAAIGSEAYMPPIKGIEGKNVISALDVYGNTDALGKKVVVIGGGEIGTETGMYIAQTDRDITIIEMKDRLADDATPIHYYSIFKSEWEKMKNLTPVCNATCTEITDKGARYTDKDGAEHFAEADSVVISAGMTAKSDEAYGYYNGGDRFYIIGDCDKVGNVQKAMRTAYATACTL